MGDRRGDLLRLRHAEEQTSAIRGEDRLRFLGTRRREERRDGPSNIGVWTAPSATQFTLTRGASSTARLTVRPSNPAFVAEYAA
jgi:hypothetical protein